MKKLLWGLLSLALLCGANAYAQEKKPDEKKDDQPRTGRQRPNFGQLQIPGGRGGQALLSDKEMEDLKLSDKQKDAVGKIVKDFAEVQKKGMEEARKALEDLRGGGVPDMDKIRELTQKMREAAQGGKAREEAEKKIVGLLDDDQKKKFEDIKKNRPRGGFGGGFPGGGGPGGGGGFPGGGGFGRPGGAFKPGQVLPPGAAERLELNDEQKKKIEDLEKKIKSELDKILTEDQKKKLEQGGGGGRPGIGGGRPGQGGGGRPGRPGQPGGENQPRRPRTDLN